MKERLALAEAIFHELIEAPVEERVSMLASGPGACSATIPD